MKLVPSTLILLFSMTYLGLWLLEKGKKHLLVFSFSFFCFSIGLLVQNIVFPASKPANVLSSSMLYFAGAFLLAEGVLMRSGYHYSKRLSGTLILSFLAALVYLTYVDSSYFILGSGLIDLSKR